MTRAGIHPLIRLTDLSHFLSKKCQKFQLKLKNLLCYLILNHLKLNIFPFWTKQNITCDVLPTSLTFS